MGGERVARYVAEMAEQPAGAGAAAAAIRRRRSPRAAAEIAARRPRFAVIAARGSSDNAARYAQHLFGRFWGLPVALADARRCTRSTTRRCDYRRRARDRDLAVRRLARRRGRGGGRRPRRARVTIAITNEPDSPLADRGHARDRAAAPAPERSVAATKTCNTHLGSPRPPPSRPPLAQDGARTRELAGVPGRPRRASSSAATMASTRPPRRRGRLAAARRDRPRRQLRDRVRGGAEDQVSSPAWPPSPPRPPTSCTARSRCSTRASPCSPSCPRRPRRGRGAAGTKVCRRGRARAADVTVIAEDDDIAAPGERRLVRRCPEWLSPLIAVVPAQLFAVGVAERSAATPTAPRA